MGSSNGIILDNIFRYKTMIFINAVVSKSETILYDLCIADLSSLMPEQVNAVLAGKSQDLAGKLKRYPLVYTGILSKINPDLANNVENL